MSDEEMKVEEIVDGDESKSALAESDEKPVEEPKAIEQQRTKDHMLDVGPGAIGGELPCGYLDDDGKLHREFVVKEMTGEEEDLLAGVGPVMPRLNQIITNCLVRLGDLAERKDLSRAVAELTAVDRVVVLIALRRVSLGDRWSTKVICRKCEKENRAGVNLKDMEVIPMPKPRERHFETELSSGKVIQWHVLSAEDEEWLTKKTKDKVDVLTLGLMARVDSIDGELIDKERDFKGALRTLKKLVLRERREIRRVTKQNEGSVDTNVDFECKFCGHEWTMEMNVGQTDFFFPSD